jgi:hypothetical protein
MSDHGMEDHCPSVAVVNSITVVVIPLENGWRIWCPFLGGQGSSTCEAHGDTREEALEIMRLRLVAWLKRRQESGIEVYNLPLSVKESE